ncbi:MAG: hypothetical protein DMF85_17680 [Acidobacteria bacterium]|nr:MAG: hypothetical protein DMF85_17680 [Acidobacteriota bacterium]
MDRECRRARSRLRFPSTPPSARTPRSHDGSGRSRSRDRGPRPPPRCAASGTDPRRRATARCRRRRCARRPSRAMTGSRPVPPYRGQKGRRATDRRRWRRRGCPPPGGEQQHVARALQQKPARHMARSIEACGASSQGVWSDHSLRVCSCARRPPATVASETRRTGRNDMRRMHGPALIRIAVWLAALGTTIAAPAMAQTTTGSIAGIVTDNTKAALPGATVTIRQVETAQSRVIVTDGSGRYRAPALEPGHYNITVELSGFRTAEFSNISLSVGENAAVDVQLELGGVTERVVVNADAAVVKTKESSIAGLVDQQQIRELPLNGRDFSQLTLLQLGVTASPSTPQAVDRGMGTQVSVAGARPNQISFQVDGADVNTQGNGSPGSAAGGMLGVDTVREFQVLVNNYSAEYGRSSGGIVVAVTRSGTNELSGSAFEFGRDSKFDSRTYFDDPTKPIPPLERNQFGGTLGGPIVRDNTFFFGSYEGLRQTQGLTTIANVPNEATRARADLSAVHPAGCQPDARESRGRQAGPEFLGRAFALAEICLRQGAGRSAAADPVLDRRYPHEVAERCRRIQVGAVCDAVE